MFFQWLPENISTYGSEIDQVMKMIWNIVFVWFVVAELLIIYFVLRYRKKKGGKAAHLPGKSWKALMWILGPAILVLGFDLGIDLSQAKVWDKIKIELPKDPDQVVRVQARQFLFKMTMPGRDGKLDTGDDISTYNLTVPINAKVVFELGSDDVVHSFWVPHLRLKQDAVPGRVIKGWFQATKTGTYPIACAELCGNGHTIMRSQLRVLDETEYQAWLDKKSPKKPKKKESPQ